MHGIADSYVALAIPVWQGLHDHPGPPAVLVGVAGEVEDVVLREHVEGGLHLILLILRYYGSEWFKVQQNLFKPAQTCTKAAQTWSKQIVHIA
jgi:hypothetical protein